MSCKKKTEPADSIDIGKDYYPIALGNYVIYDADSIVYNDLTFDSTHYKYRVKEKIEEEFTDIENKKAYRLIRYIKKFSSSISYDAMPWTVKDAWQVNMNNTTLEVVEENVRFTKLIFPIKQGSTWNGNAKNTIGEWEYSYSYIDNPESINSVSFEKVLKVTQKNFRTLISWQSYTEKYSKGVGLVYREIIDIKHPVTSTVTAIDNIPDKHGIHYTFKIVNYGHE